MAQNPYMALERANIPEFVQMLRAEGWVAVGFTDKELELIFGILSGSLLEGASVRFSPEHIRKIWPTLRHCISQSRVSAYDFQKVLRAVLNSYEKFPETAYLKLSADCPSEQARAEVFSWVLDNTEDPALVEEISKVLALPESILQTVIFTASEVFSYLMSSATGDILYGSVVEHYSGRARREVLQNLRFLIANT